jgi:hypothetical protein
MAEYSTCRASTDDGSITFFGLRATNSLRCSVEAVLFGSDCDVCFDYPLIPYVIGRLKSRMAAAIEVPDPALLEHGPIVNWSPLVHSAFVLGSDLTALKFADTLVDGDDAKLQHRVAYSAGRLDYRLIDTQDGKTVIDLRGVDHATIIGPFVRDIAALEGQLVRRVTAISHQAEIPHRLQHATA